MNITTNASFICIVEPFAENWLAKMIAILAYGITVLGSGMWAQEFILDLSNSAKDWNIFSIVRSWIKGMVRFYKFQTFMEFASKWLKILKSKGYRCLKMPALSNRWRQKTQGQLSPPTICLAAKKWTTQKTTKAWIVEGAGDGFEFLLALLVQNGIPCTYKWYWMKMKVNST